MGTMTTCSGASLGGQTSPLSSECVITSPPIMRVDTPHDVFHTCSRPPAAVWYCTLKAFAKLWPRLCDVPAWSALLSCISASRAYVRRAPANFSLSVLRTVITGIAIQFSWNVRYTPSICRTFQENRSEEHTSELQSPCNLVCRLLLEKKKKTIIKN